MKKFELMGIKGLAGDIFSTGIEEFRQKLKMPGYVSHWTNWDNHANAIINKHKSGTLKNPVVIVGHSLGAVEALHAVWELKRAGVPVACVILLDYVWRLSNVIASLFGKGAKVHPDVPTYHFRSNDMRDIHVKGALEFKYDNLNHIQLDNDVDVHNHMKELIRKHVK